MDNHVLQPVSPSAGEGSFERANFSPLSDTCVSPTPSTVSTEKVHAYLVRAACTLSCGNRPIGSTHVNLELTYITMLWCIQCMLQTNA